jgi:hypothetical protein
MYSQALLVSDTSACGDIRRSASPRKRSVVQKAPTFFISEIPALVYLYGGRDPPQKNTFLFTIAS